MNAIELIFSLNGELQDAIDFFDTEEEAVRYCLKEANINVKDCRSRRFHSSILHSKDKCIVEIYFFLMINMSGVTIRIV